MQAAALAVASLSAALQHLDATILSKYQEGSLRGWVLQVRDPGTMQGATQLTNKPQCCRCRSCADLTTLGCSLSRHTLSATTSATGAFSAVTRGPRSTHARIATCLAPRSCSRSNSAGGHCPHVCIWRLSSTSPSAGTTRAACTAITGWSSGCCTKL